MRDPFPRINAAREGLLIAVDFYPIMSAPMGSGEQIHNTKNESKENVNQRKETKEEKKTRTR